MKDYSNYHNVDSNEKIKHDGLLLLEKSLNGFESREVLINEEYSSRLLVYQKWDAKSDSKKVIGKREDIEMGNVYKIDQHNWLATTFPEDNNIYKKAEITLCNSTFPISTGETEVFLGHDKYGRPIYDIVDGTTVHIPCVAETKSSINNRNQQVNIPEGSIQITMAYLESEDIQINKEFSVFNSSFKISFIDYSSVINQKGVMVITAERVVKS
ncbi:hypothetical protein LCM23_06180 [Cytobacillus kochii]|uniref:hypothetical protein n=1 Tax=Cytobacillus kochii TaxID=859143 RepID=UPI001CD768C7|nr:hypothetical protein [Cytobacillus kochii]MCA1025672.1 hypothetical protein [Cytobacillus kochii]